MRMSGLFEAASRAIEVAGVAVISAGITAAFLAAILQLMRGIDRRDLLLIAVTCIEDCDRM
jgi:hypothetical protein